MGQRTVTIRVPDKKLIRIKRKSKRTWIIDFRGIRKHPPKTLREFEVLMGIRKGRSYHGEKPAFSSPEKLQKQVDEYFLSCYQPVIKDGEFLKDNKGNIVKKLQNPPTVSGLAYHLEVQTSTLNRYCSGQMDDLGESDEDMLFSAILQRAKQRIEIFAEERLYDKGAQAGARFVLDTHFGRITQKEQAEIMEKRMNSWIKAQELQLKKELVNSGDAADNELKIEIVRKEK